jgi:hypothetical protein
MSSSDLQPARWPALAPHDLAQATAFLAEYREDVVHRLGVHFASGDVGRREVERRVALALRARTPDTLELLLADLPPLDADVDPRTRAAPLVAAEAPPERGVLAAVMGGHGRKGAWLVPRHLKIVAVMGGVELDLRAARFGPGVTEIEILVIMGGVEIVVPPGMRVETLVITAMGGAETDVRELAPGDPDAPILRISGFAALGGVGVTTRRADTKRLTRFAALLERARARARRRDG